MGYSTQTGLFRGSWLQTVRYYRNDSVVFGGAFYAATEDNINFPPTAQGAPWEPISQANVGDMFTSVYDPTKSGKVLKSGLADTATDTPTIIAPRISSGTQLGSLTIGALFILGDSLADSVGNEAYLSSSTIITYPDSYSVILARKYSQPLCAIGRYTPSGSPPNVLGRNYALAGAYFAGNTTLVGSTDKSVTDQANRLISDYTVGGVLKLPANTVVVVETGLNSVLTYMVLGGGQFSGAANSIWNVNGNQVVPAAGTTMNLLVHNTTGATVGSGSNSVEMPVSIYGMVVALTGVDATHLSFTVPAGPYAGLTITDNTAIQPYAQYWANTVDFPAISSALSQLIAAGATIIFASPPDASLLPAQLGVSLAHSTWLMYCYQLQQTYTALGNTSTRQFDLQPIYSDITTNPTKYGFKNANTAWPGAPNSQNDYFFNDQYHPTPAGFRALSVPFLNCFNAWGYSL